MTRSRWFVLKLMSMMIVVTMSSVGGIVLLTPPLTAQSPVSRASDTAWTVEDVTILTGSDVSRRMFGGPIFLLSPDASRLAWINREYDLCQSSLTTRITVCYPLATDYHIRAMLSWSPDSRHLLLDYTDAVTYMFEAVTGEARLVEREALNSPITWNVSGEGADAAAVYYLSTTLVDGSGMARTRMHRLATNARQRERFDFATIFETPLYFDALIPVSADGTRFVLLLRISPSPEHTPGLWVVDIAVQEAELLASYSDFEADLLLEHANDFDLGDMRWDRERDRLLVTLQSSASPHALLRVASIDLDTGERVPLLTSEDIRGFDHQVFALGSDFTPDAGFILYDNEHSTASNGWKSIYALPLDAPGRAPMLVTRYRPCLPGAALITLRQTDGGRGGVERRYVYEPNTLC